MATLHNRTILPENKRGLDQFKVESAREIGVILSVGNNGDITSKGNGNIGSQMVKEISVDFNEILK